MTTDKWLKRPTQNIPNEVQRPRFVQNMMVRLCDPSACSSLGPSPSSYSLPMWNPDEASTLYHCSAGGGAFLKRDSGGPLRPRGQTLPRPPRMMPADRQFDATDGRPAAPSASVLATSGKLITALALALSRGGVIHRPLKTCRPHFSGRERRETEEELGPLFKIVRLSCIGITSCFYLRCML